MINILLVGSYRLVCASLSQIINNSIDYNVVGIAEDSSIVSQLVKEKSIDVVLMEVGSPKIEHFDLVRSLREVYQELKIVVLSAQSSQSPVFGQFLEAGAHGYLGRQSSGEEVICAINEVVKGNRFINVDNMPSMSAKNPLQQYPGNPFAVLSERELQVMIMITAGCKVHSISDQLCLSPKTINTYRYRLFTKLGVDSDVALTRLAIRQGLVEA